MSERRFTYRDAGVDIEAGDRAVELMQQAVRATHNPRVLTGLGDFGGFYALGDGPRDPVLVASTDGVGTKLKIAFALDRHDTVGQDLVAMCVDDIVVHGARPLFMLDYLAVGRLDPTVAARLVGGIARACAGVPCALIGGETAELPGFYAPGEYDLAGFAVGIVDRDKLVDGSGLRAGDVLLGLASSGLHSNGYSLARAVLLPDEPQGLDRVFPELGRSVGEELLEPTLVYAGPLVRLFAEGLYPQGLAHITGGGIPGNLSRVLPPGLAARVERGSWNVPPLFDLLRREGNIAEEELYRTFNMGLGMIAVVRPEQADLFREKLSAAGLGVSVVGDIVPAGDASPRVMLV